MRLYCFTVLHPPATHNIMYSHVSMYPCRSPVTADAITALSKHRIECMRSCRCDTMHACMHAFDSICFHLISCDEDDKNYNEDMDGNDDNDDSDKNDEDDTDDNDGNGDE